MDEDRRRTALRTCDYFRRGILTAGEACGNILFFCVEPLLAAEYVGLLPDDLRAALAKFLPALPDTDEGWAGFQGVGQIDGNEWWWAQMVVDCRANTEATREYLFGQASPPASADFVDRVRAAYRECLDEVGRSVILQLRMPAEPGAADVTLTVKSRHT